MNIIVSLDNNIYNYSNSYLFCVNVNNKTIYLQTYSMLKLIGTYHI